MNQEQAIQQRDRHDDRPQDRTQQTLQALQHNLKQLPAQDARLVHVMRQDIRWGDMDAFGHVNNTVYFRYMETARIAFLEQTAGAFDAEGQGPVIVTAYCSFGKQLKYPGQIEVRTFAGPAGRASFEVTHEIRLVGQDGQAGEVHAAGGAKVVWVDYEAEKSVALPAALKAALPAA